MKLTSWLLTLTLCPFLNNEAVLPVAAEAFVRGAAPPEDTAWSTYCNSRYGYCIDYPPQLFLVQPEAPAGDGCIFLDKKGNEVLRVFGRNNSDPDLHHYTVAEQLKEDTLSFLKDRGARVVYRKAARRFSVFSGIRQGTIHYRKTIIVDKDLAFVVFQYPEADKKIYDAVIARMGASFH
jgi:hypothetical protein